MFRILRIVACIGLLLGLIHNQRVLHAQEAAVMNGAQAVRFEQGHGFFHYVVFCKTPREFMDRMPAATPPGGNALPGGKLPPESMEYGLCWYVDGSRDAGGNASPKVEGRLVVSDHHVRFLPNDPQAADLYLDLPRDQAAVKHEAGQIGAVLAGKGVTFSFRFSKLCLTCGPGTPTPPGVASAGELDQEFSLLDETILHFYSGWRQIYRMSSGAPADSTSRAQTNSVASTGSSKSELTRQNASSRPAVAATGHSTSSAAPGAQAFSASAPGASTTSEAQSKTAVPLAIVGSRAKPVKIGSGAADGLLVKKVPPDYPLEAKLVRLEGTVVLRAVIDKAGEVSEVNAVSGPPLLESAAVDAVKQWRYRPYSLNGQPVDVETTIAVVFALDGSHPANRAQSARR